MQTRYIATAAAQNLAVGRDIRPIIGMAAGQWIPGVLGVALLYIGGIPARRKS